MLLFGLAACTEPTAAVSSSVAGSNPAGMPPPPAVIDSSGVATLPSANLEQLLAALSGVHLTLTPPNLNGFGATRAELAAARFDVSVEVDNRVSTGLGSSGFNRVGAATTLLTANPTNYLPGFATVAGSNWLLTVNPLTIPLPSGSSPFVVDSFNSVALVPLTTGFAPTTASPTIVRLPADLAGPASGGARISLELCRDYPAWSLPVPSARPYELATHCGPIGWASSLSGSGNVDFRIPFRVRIFGLALGVGVSCTAGLPAGSAAQTLCSNLTSQLSGAPALAACLNQPGRGVSAVGLLPNSVGDPATSNGTEFVAELRLQLQPCAPQGRGDLLAPVGPARGFCLTFPEALSSPPVNIVPSVALVAPANPIRGLPTLDSAGNPRPLGLQLTITNNTGDPGCRALADVANIAIPLFQTQLEQLLLTQLVGQLLGPVLNPFLAYFTAPTPTLGVARAPTCALNASASASDFSSCLQQWVGFSAARTTYRYLTTPFVQPSAPESRRWASWSLSPDTDPTGRQTLRVQTERWGHALMNCPAGSRGDPTLDPFQDPDGDSIPNACDNCPQVPNLNQRNCNADIERQLGYTTYGVTNGILGDACDPNPCGWHSRVEVADPAAPLERRVTLRPMGYSGAGGVVADEGNGPLFPPVQPRRCVCAEHTLDGDAQVPAEECRSRLCREDGQEPGRAQALANSGYQLADWRFERGFVLAASQPGPDPTNRGGTLLRDVLAYRDEITSNPLSIARGQQGREYLDDVLDPGLVFGLEDEYRRRLLLPLGIDQSTFARAEVRFWTRASDLAVLGPRSDDPPHRLTDSYSTAGLMHFLRVAGEVFRPQVLTCPVGFCSPGATLDAVRDFAFFPVGHPWAKQQGLRALGLLPLTAQSSPQLAPLQSPPGSTTGPLTGLGVLLTDASTGQLEALGRSVGDVPSVVGGAVVPVADPTSDRPHVLLFGGLDGKTFSPWIYDAAVEATSSLTELRWTRRALAQPNSLAPAPRAFASAVATPDGARVYLFGGLTTKQVSTELWEYTVASGAWRVLSAPADFSGRRQASLATDGSRLVAFGGLDASGAPQSDLFVLYPDSGISQRLLTNTQARADAAALLEGDHLLLFGGTATADPQFAVAQVFTNAPSAAVGSDSLVTLSLATGTELARFDTNLQALGRSALGRDSRGNLVVAPAGVGGGAVASLVGESDAVSPVAPASSQGATACGPGTDSSYGQPCQSPDRWNSLPGTLGCSIDQSLQCVGSRTASSPAWQLPNVEHWASAGRELLVSSGSLVRLYRASDTPTLLGTWQSESPVRAVQMDGSLLLVANQQNLVLLQAPARGSSALRVLATAPLCGLAANITLFAHDAWVDTTAGVERITVGVGTLQRRSDLLWAPQLSEGEAEGSWRTFGARELPSCRLLARTYAGSLGALQRARTMASTSDRVLWITQGSQVLALRAETNGSVRIVARTRVGATSLATRALGESLAVLGSERSGAVQRRLLTLVERPSDNERSERGEREERDEREERGERRWRIESVSGHQLGTWITEQPHPVGMVWAHLLGSTLEASALAR